MSMLASPISPKFQGSGDPLSRLLSVGWDMAILLGLDGGPTRVEEDPGNPGFALNLLDLSGNGRNITQPIQANQMPLVTVGADTAVQGAVGRGMDVPVDWLSGATEFTLIILSQKTVNNTMTIFSADNYDYRVKWISGTTLAQNIGGIANQALLADEYNDPRMYGFLYDAAGIPAHEPSLNSFLSAFWFDKGWREIQVNGVLPAAVPALTTGYLGNYGGTEYFEGNIFGMLGVARKLSDAQLAKVSESLSLLVDFVGAMPNPNPLVDPAATVEMAQVTVELAVGAAVDETAVGHTWTPRTSIIIGTGAPHTGFPGAIGLPPGSADSRAAWRNGTNHGYDPNSELVYALSSDNGNSYGAQQFLYSVPGVDVRDVNFYEWDGVQEMASYLYTNDAMQCFAGPFAGAADRLDLSITGCVLDTRAIVSTNTPVGFPDTPNKWVLNGSQWPFAGEGTKRRIGIVDRNPGVNSIYWIQHPTEHLDESGLVRVDANTLLIACRAVDAAYINTTPMVLLRSTDNGQTWGEFHTFSFSAARPFLYKHSSGLIVMAFREYDGANRYVSYVWSADGGLTWSDVTNGRLTPNLGGDCGYPAIVEGADGRLVVIYYTSTDIHAIPIWLDVPAFAWPVVVGPIATSPDLAAWWGVPESSYTDAGPAVWVDAGPNGWDLTQATAGAIPTDDLIGWPSGPPYGVLSGDGGDYVENGGPAVIASGDDTALTIGCSFKADTNVSGDVILGFGSTTGAHWLRLAMGAANFEIQKFDSINRVQAIAPVDTDMHSVVIVLYGTTVSVWWDDQGKVVDGAALNTTGAQSYDTFAALALVRATAIGHSDARVREIFLLSNSVSDVDAAAMLADLRSRAPTGT